MPIFQNLFSPFGNEVTLVIFSFIMISNTSNLLSDRIKSLIIMYILEDFRENDLNSPYHVEADNNYDDFHIFQLKRTFRVS